MENKVWFITVVIKWVAPVILVAILISSVLQRYGIVRSVIHTYKNDGGGLTI